MIRTSISKDKMVLIAHFSQHAFAARRMLDENSGLSSHSGPALCFEGI